MAQSRKIVKIGQPLPTPTNEYSLPNQDRIRRQIEINFQEVYVDIERLRVESVLVLDKLEFTAPNPINQNQKQTYTVPFEGVRPGQFVLATAFGEELFNVELIEVLTDEVVVRVVNEGANAGVPTVRLVQLDI